MTISSGTRAARLFAATLITCAIMLSTATPASAAPLREGTLLDATIGYNAHPETQEGMNDWGCEPSAAHPHPVVLLPGTFANIGSNFVKAAPRLKNAGYCVFGTNYGFTNLSAGRVGGLDYAAQSGEQVAAFIEQVLDATGSDKVDIVGHSQGGLQGINYIKNHGGAPKVAHFIGWGQSANGTTLSGLVTLGETLEVMGFADSLLVAIGAPGLRDQMAGSEFVTALDAAQLPAGPEYTSLITTRDLVVTPYHTQTLPGANNVILQDRCPLDQVGHVGLFLDSPTLDLTLNALADGPADFQPVCADFGPQLL